jgi:hypothetical protein
LLLSGHAAYLREARVDNGRTKRVIGRDRDYSRIGVAGKPGAFPSAAMDE